MNQPGFDFDAKTLTVAPSPFLEARETSALAAVDAQGIRGTQNTTLLALITAAGESGLSDPEIAAATGWSRQTICIRRFDLRGFLVPSIRGSKSPAGKACVCWRRASVEEQQQIRTGADK